MTSTPHSDNLALNNTQSKLIIQKERISLHLKSICLHQNQLPNQKISLGNLKINCLLPYPQMREEIM